MNEETQGGLLILTGGVVARMALTDTYLLYVRAGMRPWLLASALVLLALGALRIWSALRPMPTGAAHTSGPSASGDSASGDSASGHSALGHSHVADDRHGDEHGGHRPPRVAWLLVVPVLAVVLIAPNPLGSFTAERQSAAQTVAPPPDPFPPLQQGSDGTVAMPVLEFVSRALYDDNRSLAGVPVRLVGMVTPAGKGGTEDFRLTRFMIACCAADAQAVQIAVHGVDGTIPPSDSWVEIVGRWRAPAAGVTADDDVPSLDIAQLKAVPQPENPYEG